MADEQIVTSIVAKADLSSLVSEVHRVTASLQQLQRELIASNKSIAASTKVANNAFKDTLVQSGLFSSHFVNLRSDVDKFGKNLDAGRLKLKDYFSTFQTHLKTSKGMIRELAREQVMLENAVLQPLGRNAQGLMQYNVHIPRGLDLVKNKAQLARMELQIFNRALLEGSTSLINWGKNTQWAGRQLTVGLTVPLTMFGTAAAKAFREADQELTRLVKVYGDIAGTSAQELGKIRKDVTATAKELSSAMGVSFKETLALAADVAATGKTGQDLISSVKETTRLAVLGEVDRQEAMKATLAIQTAFKSNTEELTESINFLNAVENQTSTTLNDLVEAIPKAGTVVKQLGGSVEDLALYITAMREGGVNASEAANALKSGLASMINPTKQTIGVMSDFGIDIMGMVAKNTGNTTGMIMDLQSALDTLDPLSKARALEQMFGKFQFARMAALFNNLNKEGSQTVQVMELMNASASELATVAGRELALVTESASGKFRRAVESLKASLTGVGEQFLNFGTKVLNVFEKIVNFFSDLPAPIQKLLTLFGGLTAIAGPLIMITGVLANFFGYITKGVVLMRQFFSGQKGWKMLTPEMIAAERAAKMVEKSFYSDAAAANVLHTALQKLINDYASLRSGMTSGAVPVNPSVSTVGGSLIIPGLRRQVDAGNPYVGEEDTRAISHINPRDRNKPASWLGGVPGAIPVNHRIGANPQIYMMDRLPDIEGLTSFGGVSSGIVADEAARFHALMATLGMQTEAEVAALKKTIALGGTVSHELLSTFDDILPITMRLSQNAAKDAAGIVQQLRSGHITIDQARAQILALNAQLEAQMQAEVAQFAALRGRTVDFTKAPLMQQPTVDANAQFTLRDLYKKDNNRAVMEEFGRLRGIRTYGAPYSIHVTRLPKFNVGGPIRSSKIGYGEEPPVEGFGPNKTTVSGPTSIGYDDRLGSIPLGGYVLNQSASLDPNNSFITDPSVVASTYSGGGSGSMTAALTPGEIVYGPGIMRDPELFAAVDAANRGFNFGGQIVSGRGAYGGRPNAAQIIKMTKGVWNRAVSRQTLNVRSVPLSRHFFSTGTGADPGARRIDLLSSHQAGWKIVDPSTKKVYTKQELELLSDDEVNKLWKGIDRSHFADPVYRSDTGQYVMPALFGPHYRHGKGGNLDVIKGGNPAEILKSLQNGLMHPFSTMISSAKILGYPGKKVDRAFAEAWKEAKAELRNRARNKKNFGKDEDTFGQFMEQILKKHLRKLKIPNTNINYFDEMRSIGNIRGSGISGSGPAVYDPNNKDITFGSANLGGYIPRFAAGGMINRLRGNYGTFIGMPTRFKRSSAGQKIADFISTRVSSSRLRNVVPTDYGHLLSPSGGRSFPVEGVGGVYKKPNGDVVFVKPMVDETSARAELRATTIARLAHGLDSPRQTMRVMKDPTDPLGKRKFIVLESPYDPKFAQGGSRFSKKQMFKQNVAAFLRGDKDLSASNLFGNVLADVGTAGVFPRASGFRYLGSKIPSMKEMAMIDLLGVKGGAKKAYAQNTAKIASKLTPDQYHDEMISEINRVLPRLRKVVSTFNLTKVERKAYESMIKRLEEGLETNWRPFQKIHAKAAPKYNRGGIIGYNRGGGIVRRSRRAYGEPWSGNPGSWRNDPKYTGGSSSGTPTYFNVEDGPGIPGFDLDPADQDSRSPMRGRGAMMLGSVALGMGGGELGRMLTGGSMWGSLAGYMAGEVASYKLMDAMINKSKTAAKQGSLTMRAFSWLWKLPGPVKLIAVLVTLGLAVKKVFDAINNHRKTVSLAFGPSEQVIEKLNLKFTTLNNSLNATRDRLKAIKESGGALYAAYTSAGIPGVTLTIKQLQELKDKVTQDLPELIQMLDQAAGSEVSAKAESLKAQFVAGGMTAQEATNLVYALISASNKATFAIRAIASEGFRSITDEATAASSAIKTFFNLVQQGNVDQLVSAFDTVFNSLESAERKLLGLEIAQYGLVDAAEAYQITLERINGSTSANQTISGKQLETLKAQNPVLLTILGTSETLASIFAKLRMYSMGISMDFTQLDPKLAQTLSIAIMKMDTFYRTDQSKKNPFAALVKQINEAKTAAQAADEKTFKNAEKKKEDLEELIELKQKEIDAIKEEADERRRALEQEQQDEDILLQIKKKQLEYNNALAAGDMQTAAQAQLDIQRLVGQQQTEFAKRAIDEKERKDIDAKEAEIDSLRNQIEFIQDQLEAAQETAKKGAENLTKLEDFLGRSIQALMMGQGGYDETEQGILKGLIAELSKVDNPALRAIIPVLQNELKTPKETEFDNLLQTTLETLNTNVLEQNRILGLTKTPQAEVPEDTRTNWQKFWDGFFERTIGWSPIKKADGGYIRGPGTGTSDSIPGYITGFSGGGAVPIRVSNTEYITRSSSVEQVGVPNMDLINERGAEGVIMAAQNILGVQAKTGGYVNGLLNYAYAQGSKGGLPKTMPKQFDFSKLNDRTVYAMKYLVSKGMTAEAAAGIVGNLIAESTLRTGAMEAGHTREGRGIAQWGVNARWKTYQNWLKKNGKKGLYDLNNQLDFIWWEMHNGQLPNPNMFKGLNDISKAAYIFMDKYERPGVLRWKERNTWAYKAYKLYTGKDYANMSRPGPDTAKADYEKGLSSPAVLGNIDPEIKNIIPLNVSGVSKLSALGFKSGGYLGFKGGSTGGLPDDGGRYDKLKDYFSKLGDLSVNFKTDRYDLNASEIAELKQIAQEVKKSGAKTMHVRGYADKRGSVKYNMALSKRRADYVAQILRYLAPGIDFIPMAVGEENSKSSLLAMSKKRRVSIELPPKGSGGLSLPSEPRGMMGSSPLEGLFPGGGFQGLMTMAKGGYLGFDKGGSPKSKQGLFNRILASLSKPFSSMISGWSGFGAGHSGFGKYSGSAANVASSQTQLSDKQLSDVTKQTGYFLASELSGIAPTSRLLSGTSHEVFGNKAAGIGLDLVGMLPLLGATTKLSQVAAAGNITPKIKVALTPRSVLKNKFDELKSSGAIENNRAAFDKSRFQLALKDAMVASKKHGFTSIMDLPKTKYQKLYEENLKLQPRFEEILPTTPEGGKFLFRFRRANLPPDETSSVKDFLSDIRSGKKPYEFPANTSHEVEVIDRANGAQVAFINYDPISGFIHYRSTANSYRYQGWSDYLYNKAASFTRIRHSGTLTPDGAPSALKMGGLMAYDNVFNLENFAKLKSYVKTIKKKKKKKIVITKQDLEGYAQNLPTPPYPRVSTQVSDGIPWQNDRLLDFQPLSDLENIRPAVRAWFENPYRRTTNFPYMNGSGVEDAFAPELFRLAGLEKNAGLQQHILPDEAGDAIRAQRSSMSSNSNEPVGLSGWDRPGAQAFGEAYGRQPNDVELAYFNKTGKGLAYAKGGYFAQLRKFHDWNGVIPGNYGQEVGAILQAGKESVYDTDYINALKNGTMNSTTSNSKIINVGSVKMEFTEPVTNGKQIFEEFKALVNFENSKSGPSINIGMR